MSVGVNLGLAMQFLINKKMSSRLKLILGGLMLVAGFLVVRVGAVLTDSLKINKSTANISGAVSNNGDFDTGDPIKKDSDHDGLPDREEIIYGADPFNPDTDGDGYKDGEEIAAGTDPLSPNDSPKTRAAGGSKSLSLISPTANLTDRVLNMGLASMINDSGNLDPSQMNNKKFADVLTSINEEAIMYLSPPPITDNNILISEDNSPEAVKKYVDTLSSIVEEGMFNPGLTETSADVFETSFVNYYENKYNALKLIQVPSSWKEMHKTTLTNLKIIANCVTALTSNAIDADPVKASYALNFTQSSLLALVNVLSSMTELAIKQKIPVDSIMQMFQALNTSLSTK